MNAAYLVSLAVVLAGCVLVVCAAAWMERRGLRRLLEERSERGGDER